MRASCCYPARGTAYLLSAKADDVPARRDLKLLKVMGSGLTGAGAILLPKCPLCLAAWIAAGTGFAVPAMVLSSIRPLLVIACVLPTLLMLRSVLRRYRHVGPGESQDNHHSPRTHGMFDKLVCPRDL